ncbi:MAG TPA: dipeptidase [Nocardioidaceae bacterium]|nr:dipeptidase [Nocardioidaceae bacterium]
MPTTHSVDELRARVSDVMAGVRRDLETLVRIQSVSADPARASEVQRSAEATADLFRAEGLEAQIVSAASGAPAVLAHKPGPPGAPTVLLYAHHDVQPEGDHAVWESPPFEPTERGDRLYGRGAADDKAGIAAHLAAIRAIGPDLPVSVTVFVEGEEEISSPTLTALLAEHSEALRADVIVIPDSINWDVGTPALTTSLRGCVDFVIELRTLKHAVHSGMWGGPVPDSLTALCRLLASFHDDAGDVAVAGLVRSKAADLHYPDDRIRAEAGMAAGVELIGTGSVVDRIWTKPSVSVLALDTTRIADASNTLIPVSRAKVSVRLAPGDSAANAMARLREHVVAATPWGAQVTFTPGDVGDPFSIDAEGSAYAVARKAFEDAWDGTAPVDIGVGGSIPFIAEFADAFPDAAILVTGVEDPDTRAHGENEGLHLAEFARVCLAEALLLQRLGTA